MSEGSGRRPSGRSYTSTLLAGLRRVTGSDLGVTWVRALQEARIAWLRSTNGWERLARSTARWWTPSRVSEFIDGPARGPVAADGAPAVAALVARGNIPAEELLDRARRIRERDFSVSGRPLPPAGPWPWSTDWRHGHTWERLHFREYDHYGPREEPYDVRAVWELTRLWFLQPLLQAAAIDSAGPWDRATLEILEDFESSNPVGHTINWHPMEVAMRSVSLALLLGMARSLPQRSEPLIAALLRMLTLHAAFLYRTVEYGNIRHNHFMANAAALAVAGATLQGSYPPARRWLAYGAAHLEREIPAQVLPDGVGFEKSTSYHRMVTELQLLTIIALERAGAPLTAMARERVHRAARFSAHTTRADGLSVNFGDNDGARVFAFDSLEQRDHRPYLAAAASLFADAGVKAISSGNGARPLLTTAWLLGAEGLAKWEALPGASAEVLELYPEGGMVALRQGSASLAVDVGEVGLRGRGGHGHNDLLSYELCLEGRPLIVDPGSPVYTGDIARLDLYRSTAYHNGLQVDGEEIAPFTGLWRIADTARPEGVSLTAEAGEHVARAAHTGYLRLVDPVLHTRELRLGAGSLQVVDIIECEDERGSHRVERHLHLAPEIEVEIIPHGARLTDGERIWSLRHDEQSDCAAHMGTVSPSFGEEIPAAVLTISTLISGGARLHYRIEPERES